MFDMCLLSLASVTAILLIVVAGRIATFRSRLSLDEADTYEGLPARPARRDLP